MGVAQDTLLHKVAQPRVQCIYVTDVTLYCVAAAGPCSCYIKALHTVSHGNHHMVNCALLCRSQVEGIITERDYLRKVAVTGVALATSVHSRCQHCPFTM